MNSKAIAAIVIVAVVVVAAVVIAIGNGGNDDNSPTIDAAGDQGTVFGNANGDCRIDEEDVQLIEQLISNNNPDDINDYPLADVNHDGAIDEADVTLVRNIINGTATTVDVSDFTGNVVTVNYPMDNLLVVGGTNMRVVVSVLNMEDRILANATNSYCILDHISTRLSMNFVRMGRSLH